MHLRWAAVADETSDFLKVPPLQPTTEQRPFL